MNRLPREVAHLILGYLDDISLASACSVNRDIRYRVCNNDYWIQKIREKYGLELDDFVLEPDQSYAAYYFELHSTFQLRDPTQALKYFSRHGGLDVVKASIFLGADIEASMFYGAAQNGHYDIIKYLFDQGYQPTTASDRITLRQAAGEAAKNNRQDILELFRSYGYVPL